jgi:hypothetical protein
MAGNLSMNSEIGPNFITFCGWTFFVISSAFSGSLLVGHTLNSRTVLPIGSLMILSKSANAPPPINEIFHVFTVIHSCSGCLRPPIGGTLQVVP